MNKPRFSIVVPIYNEQENIPILIPRLLDAAKKTGQSFEIVLVNDGSKDHSLPLLVEWQKKTPELVIVEFNRNFGQHAAVFAGFAESRGEFVITIDADLQNPPEEIPKILAKFDEGYDVVATIRKDRQDTAFRRYASKMINKITRRLTGVDLHDYGCMLRGYSREVVDAMSHTQELSTFIPALGASFGRNLCEIEVAHASRAAGESKYNLFRLISLQFDLVTSFSLKPIRFLTFVGVGIASLACAFAIFLIMMRFLYGAEWGQFGVFTLFAVMFFFIGAQFVVLGLLGEYIGRIYMEVRDRPRYLIRKVYRSGT